MIIKHLAWFVSYNSIKSCGLLYKIGPHITGGLILRLLQVSIILNNKFDLGHWKEDKEKEGMEICTIDA